MTSLLPRVHLDVTVHLLSFTTGCPCQVRGQLCSSQACEHERRDLRFQLGVLNRQLAVCQVSQGEMQDSLGQMLDSIGGTQREADQVGWCLADSLGQVLDSMGGTEGGGGPGGWVPG